MRIILAVFFLIGIWSQTLSAFSLQTDKKIKDLIHDMEHKIYTTESSDRLDLDGLADFARCLELGQKDVNICLDILLDELLVDEHEKKRDLQSELAKKSAANPDLMMLFRHLIMKNYRLKSSLKTTRF